MTPRLRMAGLALGLALVAMRASAATTVIRARVFDGDRWREQADVVVGDDGRIASVGEPGASPAVTAAGATLTPGFWDLDARLLPRDEDGELPETVATDLRLADGLALDAAARDALRRSGVTTAWLSGADSVVIAGRAALLQPSAGDGVRVLEADWGLSCSLASAARLAEREPSSLPAQVRLLEPALEGVAAQLARIRFDDGAGARQAARLALPVGLPSRPEDLAELDGARGFVASIDWTRVAPDVPRLLASHLSEHPLGIGSGGAVLGPAAVRVAGARLVEEGADPDVVLRVLTSGAAAMAGDAARGRVVAGSPADLVLWSGPPLSLASRPLRIWVSGAEVYHAP